MKRTSLYAEYQVCRLFGKWPSEFKLLSKEDQIRLLAFVRLINKEAPILAEKYRQEMES